VVRSISLVAVVFLVIMAVLPLSHAATGIVDQKQELDNDFSLTILLNSPVGQEFIPSLSPLIGIDVNIMTANPTAGDDTITLNIRESTIGGSVLSTASRFLVEGFDGWLHFDLPSPVTVNPGSTYIIELTEAKATFGWYACDVPPNVYPNGRLISGGNPFNDIDFTFRTYAPVRAPVGGYVAPVNKIAVLTPYIALAGLIAILSTVFVKRRLED